MLNMLQTTRTEITSAPVSDNSIFLQESVMRGHHIFKGIWTPKTEEIVQVRQEAGNPHDRKLCCGFAQSRWNGGWTCA